MNGRKLFAIAVILFLATAAWFVLGGSVEFRTHDSSGSLGSQVEGLWGGPQRQVAPSFAAKATTGSVEPELVGSDIDTTFKLDQRRKGLMWYSTYVVDFAAVYRLKNPAAIPQRVTMQLAFPTPDGIYDGFAVRVAGREVGVTYREGMAIATFDVPATATVSIQTGYRSNGMDSWAYIPSPEGVGVIKDFRLAMKTDFPGIDYPGDGVSPTTRSRSGAGWELAWDYDSLVSGRTIGVLMPTPMNPGPLVSRITFFAPVSLLFFFAALILLTATSGVKLHPVHYGFLAAAFFAFDLLLAYLADRIDINVAFAIGAVTSVALVLGYLRVVVGRSRALFEIAVSQFVFLVLFAYSFFFEGYTGLAITIGSVLTLAYFMIKTAHVDWDTVFVRKIGAPTQAQIDAAMRASVGAPMASQAYAPPYPPQPPAPPARPSAPSDVPGLPDESDGSGA